MCMGHWQLLAEIPLILLHPGRTGLYNRAHTSQRTMPRTESRWRRGGTNINSMTLDVVDARCGPLPPLTVSSGIVQVIVQHAQREWSLLHDWWPWRSQSTVELLQLGHRSTCDAKEYTKSSMGVCVRRAVATEWRGERWWSRGFFVCSRWQHQQI